MDHRASSQPIWRRRAGDHRCETISEFLRRPISDFLRWGYSLDGEFANVVERLALHLKGWLEVPDVLVVRYEQLHADFRAVVKAVSKHVGLTRRLRQRPVGLKDAPSILPRKGVVGDWQNAFTPEDETFVRTTFQQIGLDWGRVAWHG